MVLLAALALALTGVAVAALYRSLTLRRAHVAAHLDHLGAYGFAPGAPTAALQPGSPRGRALPVLVRRLGDSVARRLGAGEEAKLHGLLVAAGLYNTPVRTVLGYRVLAAAGLAGCGVLLGHGLLVRLAIAGFLSLCGWILPVAYLRRRVKQRALAIERETPNLIDQIVVSLEAGMGFSASLQTWTNRLQGPLGEEMRLALQEQRMGASLTEALQHLRERVESPNLQSFVRAVVQGERLGVSLGQIMRDLAHDMRKRRRQMAEERAQKTPVKLLIPLVFLILPTIFIVVLVPPVLEIMHGF
jgi:tight adherence protein C